MSSQNHYICTGELLGRSRMVLTEDHVTGLLTEPQLDFVYIYYNKRPMPAGIDEIYLIFMPTEWPVI